MDLQERLQQARQTGTLTLTEEEAQFLLMAIQPWVDPQQVFRCVCGARDFGPEDYREVGDGGAFKCDSCGVEILRVVAPSNVLAVIDGENDTELADVTGEYR